MLPWGENSLRASSREAGIGWVRTVMSTFMIHLVGVSEPV